MVLLQLSAALRFFSLWLKWPAMRRTLVVATVVRMASRQSCCKIRFHGNSFALLHVLFIHNLMLIISFAGRSHLPRIRETCVYPLLSHTVGKANSYALQYAQKSPAPLIENALPTWWDTESEANLAVARYQDSNPRPERANGEFEPRPNGDVHRSTNSRRTIPQNGQSSHPNSQWH